MASDDINIQTSDNKRSSSSFGEHHDFFNGIYKLLLNFVNTMASFDVLLVTFAFLLSFGNILRKDPYMSGTFQIPVHCIIYFLLAFLLSYMCFKKVRNSCRLSIHLLIVCLIFALMFVFFFSQITYNEDKLNVFTRIFLSAGIGMFLVCIYSLHIYYENKSHSD